MYALLGVYSISHFIPFHRWEENKFRKETTFTLPADHSFSPVLFSIAQLGTRKPLVSQKQRHCSNSGGWDIKTRMTILSSRAVWNKVSCKVWRTLFIFMSCASRGSWSQHLALFTLLNNVLGHKRAPLDLFFLVNLKKMNADQVCL